MVFLTLAIFAVLSVNAYSLKASLGNRNRQTANMLASSHLSMAESILKVNFHIPPDKINTGRLSSKQYPGFDFIVEDLGYEDPGKNLRAVRVRVFWHEDGVERTYALSTTRYNY